MIEKTKWIAHEQIAKKGEWNLLCFTYPGGSASSFAPWKKFCGEEINLIPILYPMREVRRKDAMPKDFQTFVRQLVDENEGLFQSEYGFFGYCGGAVIAYEAALYAREKYGTTPVYGMVASSTAPEYVKETLLHGETEKAQEKAIAYLREQQLFDDAMLESPMFLEYYMPMFLADCALLDSYEMSSSSPLDCPLDILLGREDLLLQKKKVEAWKAYTNGGCLMHYFPGGHFFVGEQGEAVFHLAQQHGLEELRRRQKEEEKIAI